MRTQIKHLAIISDNYTLLARFYEALFGMKSGRSEEHTSELQSQTSISYAVFCLKKKKQKQ